MTLETLTKSIEHQMDAIQDEHELTAAIADVLRGELAEGLDVPDECMKPDPERYVMYPLYVAPGGRFSIAAAVWDVGQGTPVHGHETWGVVGIHSGREHEISFAKPEEEGVPLESRGEHVWEPGEVTVCCTTDDDVHQVRCEGDEPVVGIHVYGSDIGTLERRSYEPETGNVSWFVSNWASPSAE